MVYDEFMCAVHSVLNGCGFTQLSYTDVRLRPDRGGCWSIRIGDSRKSVMVEPTRGYMYAGEHTMSELRLVIRVGSVRAWSKAHIERVVGHVLRLVALELDHRVHEYHKACDEREILDWKIRMLRVSDADRVRWTAPSNDRERGKLNMGALFISRAFTLDQAMRIANICREVKK